MLRLGGKGGQHDRAERKGRGDPSAVERVEIQMALSRLQITNGLRRLEHFAERYRPNPRVQAPFSIKENGILYSIRFTVFRKGG